MKTARKWRTMYDTQSYPGTEPGGGKSLTDQSQYEPLEEKLRRFGVGEIVAGSGSDLSFEFDSDAMDESENERQFEHAEAIEEMSRKMTLKGEEAIAKEHRELNKRISIAKDKKTARIKAEEEKAFKAKVQKSLPVPEKKENIEKGKA